MSNLEMMKEELPSSEELREIMSTNSKKELQDSSALFGSNGTAELIKAYLDENLDPEFKNSDLFKEFWAILGNTIKLSFLEPDDVKDFEILFDISKYNYLMKLPDYEYTFQDIQKLDQMRIYIIAACKRSVGFSNHRFNERIILGGSITQLVRSNTEEIKSGNRGGGFLAKLKSLF